MTWEFSRTVRTDAGLCGLWRPERFARVTDLDSWEAEVGQDGALAGHVAAGAFVPINVGGDGAFQVVLRTGHRTGREARFTHVSSEPYLLVSEGTVALGGVEEVGGYVGGAVTVPLPAGRYAVTVHLVDWESDPESVTPDGGPSADALPDFVVEIEAEAVGAPAYRSSVETFDRP